MTPRLRDLTATLRAAFSLGICTSRFELEQKLDALDDTLDRRVERHRSFEHSLKAIGRDL